MNTTIWVALITALSTITPPLISKFIDYRKEIKFKGIELYDKNQKQVILDFIDATTSLIGNKSLTKQQKANYYTTSYKLFVFFPELDKNLINRLNDVVENYDDSEIPSRLKKVISELSKSLSEKLKNK